MDFLGKLLTYYGLSKEELADYAREPSFSALPPLDGLPGVEEAKQRITLAKERKEKTFVYGDYDTDGIMATSIMVRCLREIGVRVSFYIPSRYTDGYGLTLDMARRVVEQGFKLVILVDNGITLVDEVLYLLREGVDTIVIDHHKQEDVLPPAKAIIHPEVSRYGDVPVSAGYLCFMFSCVLQGYDPYLLVLGGISTLSDMMPLKGCNREIVRLLLEELRDHHVPEIEWLCQKKVEVIDEKVLGMSIIPQINAVGRMDQEHKILRLVHYFADVDQTKKPALARWMGEINEERKTLTNLAYEKISVDESEPAIVVMTNLPEGLNGLLANRLLNQYKRPVAVFSPSKSNPDCYVGSIRSGEGFDFIECKDALEAYIERGGGHAHAGGMSVRKGNYALFRKAFLEFAARHPLSKKEEAMIEITLDEANMDNYKYVAMLAPFGQGWKEPVFCLKGIPTSSLRFTFKGGYLSTYAGESTKLFSYTFTRSDMDARCSMVDFSCVWNLNTYRGRKSLDLTCSLLKQY